MTDVTPSTPRTGDSVIVERSALDALLGSIARQGYQVLGPTVHEGAIVYREVRSAADLPIGWGDEQDGGTYRLRRREDEAVFGYAVGPQSWKQFLHPPRLRLWRARRGQNGDGLEIVEEPADAPRYAFFGVRSCELHAIAIQDRVFLPGAHPDLSYAARREDALLVAVNCGEPSGTCFCVSMGTGPKASAGYDLALTEVLDGGSHRFVVEVGSDRGALVLDDVPHRPADAADSRDAEQVTAYAVARMGREMPDVDLRALLYANYEHPRWDEVAERCLTCGNCTMVCPTCFCTSGRGHRGPGRRGGRALAPLGIVLLGPVLPRHRGRGAFVAARPLSPVDDAQARDLVRSVRHVRVRGVRALHHVVPGRYRHHRGGFGYSLQPDSPDDAGRSDIGSRACRASTRRWR